ncbi:DMT family transporter [Candidatus Woesearchaeota archaeon]|nr:DMT family transporter [Candidatus Woesearchaeota archaeon]
MFVVFELLLAVFMVMVGWGVGDFLIAVLSKRTDPFVLSFWNSLFQFAMAAVVYFWFFFPSVLPARYIPLLVVYSFLAVGAFVAFFKGFSIGKASLISPISSSYGLLAMVLSMFFFGERLSFVQLAGIFVASFGLVLATVDFSGLMGFRLSSGVEGLKYALLAFVFWGVNFTLIAVLVRASDWVTPVFFADLLMLPISFALAAYRVGSFRIEFPGRSSILLLATISFLAQGAFFVYTFAVLRFPNALLAPVSAFYPGLTILLAHVFFRERITAAQYAGIAFIIAGLVLASL